MNSPICRKLFRQLTRRPFSFALAKAGNNIAARIAMIAMTTSNSISVNAVAPRRRFSIKPFLVAYRPSFITSLQACHGEKMFCDTFGARALDCPLLVPLPTRSSRGEPSLIQIALCAPEPGRDGALRRPRRVSSGATVLPAATRAGTSQRDVLPSPGSWAGRKSASEKLCRTCANSHDCKYGNGAAPKSLRRREERMLVSLGALVKLGGLMP